MNLDRIAAEVDRKKHFVLDQQRLEKELATCELNVKIAIETQAFLQEKAKEIQTQLKFFLDKINQAALDIAFPGYKFVMEFTIKNDATHAGIYVENNGRRQSPFGSNGGGLSNIIAMCSQMAAKKMCTTRDTIIADQPMKDVSKGEKENLAMEMLHQIVADVGLQYIMISHVSSQINTADRVIEIVKKDNDELGWPVSSVNSNTLYNRG